MQKQLIQQISQAMQANANTIERQQEIIDYQAQTIEELKTSLTGLAETQSQELKALPTMFEKLEFSLKSHTKAQAAWRQNRKEHVGLEMTLAQQLKNLTEAQLELTRALKQYQGILVPESELTSDMNDISSLQIALESTSEKLRESQSVIQQSQEKIYSELEQLLTLSEK